ncbi:MAG: carbon-nitrogen family hydrolase [Saprospiraceae bacterium]|nr:carbon-nitrogen family hydrolase [Saprospiraceae bacterium]
MKIAIVQMQCIPGDISGNIEKMCRWIERCEPVDMIVFPELADTGYIMDQMEEYIKHSGFGDRLTLLSEAAKKKNVHVVAGLVETKDNAIYNTAIVLDTHGEIKACYQKIHLYTPSGEGVFTPGRDLTTFEINGFKAGLMICYDTRFPEMARSLALSGCDLIIVPTAWPFPRVEHWQLLTQARAIENQCYVLAANRVGKDGVATFCGNSRIIDPHGVIVSSASEDQEEIIYGVISSEKLKFIRTRMPVFEHRRPDSYLK